MSKIIIHPHWCQIQDESDTDFLWALDRELSYKIQGAEHTSAYKRHVWDGWKKLLKDNLTFPTGLLQRVEEFYKKESKQFFTIDYRGPKSEGNTIDILPKLKEINKEPYPYQLEIIDIIRKYDCGIIRSATGSGKTIIAALIVAKLGRKSLIYVIGKDLLY